MELKFLCERCGIEIYPKQITYEDAENLNNEPLLENQMFIMSLLCVIVVSQLKEIL